MHKIEISGDEVKAPTASAKIFVKAEMRIAGPVSVST